MAARRGAVGLLQVLAASPGAAGCNQALHACALTGLLQPGASCSSSSSRSVAGAVRLARHFAAPAGQGSGGPSSAPPGGQQQGAAAAPKATSRFDSVKSGTAISAAATAAAATASKHASGAVGSLSQTSASLKDVPTVPAALGFLGALPFIMLSPVVVTPYLPTWVDSAAQLQLIYGGAIVTFLGAVHWGAAMSAGIRGASAMVVERYVWSVFPCLMAVSIAAWRMETGPGAVAMSAMLFLCYMTDRSYKAQGLLPPWYLVLRTYLTGLAITGLLFTALHYYDRDLRKATARMEQAEAVARDRRTARRQAQQGGAEGGAV